MLCNIWKKHIAWFILYNGMSRQTCNISLSGESLHRLICPFKRGGLRCSAGGTVLLFKPVQINLCFILLLLVRAGSLEQPKIISDPSVFSKGAGESYTKMHVQIVSSSTVDCQIRHSEWSRTGAGIRQMGEAEKGGIVL